MIDRCAGRSEGRTGAASARPRRERRAAEAPPAAPPLGPKSALAGARSGCSTAVVTAAPDQLRDPPGGLKRRVRPSRRQVSVGAGGACRGWGGSWKARRLRPPRASVYPSEKMGGRTRSPPRVPRSWRAWGPARLAMPEANPARAGPLLRTGQAERCPGSARQRGRALADQGGCPQRRRPARAQLAGGMSRWAKVRHLQSRGERISTRFCPF